MFSLIETAKQNGLDPSAYLNYIFDKAPFIRDAADWDKLLPSRIDRATLKAAMPTALTEIGPPPSKSTGGCILTVRLVRSVGLQPEVT